MNCPLCKESLEVQPSMVSDTYVLACENTDCTLFGVELNKKDLEVLP